MSVSRTLVEIRVHPATDDAFRERILAGVARADRIKDVRRATIRLQSYLNEEFPAARVTMQDPLGADSSTPVVYAYRDGSLIVPRDGGSDGAATHAA